MLCCLSWSSIAENKLKHATAVHVHKLYFFIISIMFIILKLVCKVVVVVAALVKYL